MKIRAIKTYQSVTFEKRSENFFSIIPISGKPAIEINMIKELMAIEVKSDKDHVIIPLTNVSAIHPWIAEDEINAQEREDRKKLKVAVNPNEIKRPR